MISYRVKAKLAKNIGTDDFCLEEFYKDFIDEESPIEARKNAFSYYLSILEVVGSGKDDIDIIEKHISKVPMEWIDIYGKRIPSYNQHNLGVGIYLIGDKEVEYSSKDAEWLILGYEESTNYLSIADNLEQEMEIYKKNAWDTKKWTVDIKYFDFDAPSEDEVVFSTVLWTPFDFWNHWNPSMVDADVDSTEEPQEVSVLQEIISKGENRNLEFKSSLRVCLREKQPKYYIEKGIIKTINAFANTEGGVLIIGVADDGNVLGIEEDINSFTEQSKDDFLKHFDNLIKYGYTEPIDAILSFGFEEVASKLVFLVNVEKSHKPRFCKIKDGGKEFYIRRSASSNLLDVEETVKYVIDKWYV